MSYFSAWLHEGWRNVNPFLLLKLQQIFPWVTAPPLVPQEKQVCAVNSELLFGIGKGKRMGLMPEANQSPKCFPQLLNKPRFPRYSSLEYTFMLMCWLRQSRGRHWFSQGDGFFYSNLSSKNSSGSLCSRLNQPLPWPTKHTKSLHCFLTVFIVVSQNPRGFMFMNWCYSKVTATWLIHYPCRSLKISVSCHYYYCCRNYYANLVFKCTITLSSNIYSNLLSAKEIQSGL